MAPIPGDNVTKIVAVHAARLKFLVTRREAYSKLLTGSSFTPLREPRIEPEELSRLIDTKDSIQIALKEYEGLRKEIDARTDGTKTYGWPVILLAGGTLVGWKSNLNLDVVLFLIPTVIMTILVLASNAAFDMDKARKALARVENRIFLLSGETLLTHESCRIIEWQKNSPWLRLAWYVGPIYLLLEIWLYYHLDIASTLKRSISPLANSVILNPNGLPQVRLKLLLLSACALSGFFMYNICRWYQLRSKKFSPELPLIKKVRANKEILRESQRSRQSA